MNSISTNGGYCQVASSVRAGIINQYVLEMTELSKEARLVYALLASIAGSGATCTPHPTAIAEVLGISKDVYTACIRELCAYGILSINQSYKSPSGYDSYSIHDGIREV